MAPVVTVILYVRCQVGMMVGIMVGMTIVPAFVMRCNLSSYVVNGREVGISEMKINRNLFCISLSLYYLCLQYAEIN